MKNASLHSKALLDCGWGVGLLTLLLQLVTLCVPEGEGRDWIYYVSAALWAGAFIGAAGAARAGVKIPHMPPEWKQAVTAYAFAAISYYVIPPLFDRKFLWLWPLALLLAWEWSGRLGLFDKRQRMLYGAGMLWFLLTAFSLSASLIYRSGWFGLMSNGSMITSAIPYIFSLALVCPLAYAALRKPYSDEARIVQRPRIVTVLLHLLAAYLLLVPLFRVDGLMYPVSYHHWKAFLEPAESVRAGGWLLWDVPAQYGFLLTWLVAIMPTDTVWQSFYLVNSGLLTLSGYMLFYVLFARYPSIIGYAFSLVIAITCTAQLLPFIDSRMMPSTGAIRFIWVYAIVGYLLYLCRFHALPRFAYRAGNALWLLGVLWSLESAVFVTILWLPGLALIAASDRIHFAPRVLIRHIAVKLLGPVYWLAGAAAIISCVYYAGIGHLPDLHLFVAYATSYTSGFNSYPLLGLDIIVCWLFVFVLLALLMRYQVVCAARNPASVRYLAVLYALLAALWVVVSAYIPISDDVHLVSTLPVMMYLSAIALLLLPALQMPLAVKACYEKAMVCFYVILVLGTVNCFKPGLYSTRGVVWPVHGDVTDIFPSPPQFMQDIIEKAKVPDGARVMLLAQPFSLEEGALFGERRLLPWLLPNSEVAYDKPLAPELYRMIAERRAARMEDGTAWLIERRDNPLARYPWIESSIGKFYTETSSSENSEYRIRRYEKKP